MVREALSGAGPTVVRMGSWHVAEARTGTWCIAEVKMRSGGTLAVSLGSDSKAAAVASPRLDSVGAMTAYPGLDYGGAVATSPGPDSGEAVAASINFRGAVVFPGQSSKAPGLVRRQPWEELASSASSSGD